MQRSAVVVELPWPPSVNSYWRKMPRGMFITAAGKRYRSDVDARCVKFRRAFGAEHRLAMRVDAFPPDRRGRDLDNILKALNDSLESARVFPNDSQIDDLRVVRRERRKGGAVVVRIELLGIPEGSPES